MIHKESFPETLRNMHRPPQNLYARGSWPNGSDRKYLCVVGSRKQSEYGASILKEIILGLKGYPISIVSGLAYGIDGSAHRAALEAGLHCVVFPGSTLEWNELYPREHLDLAKTIVQSGGLLLSEWSADDPMGKWVFAARNRLMAGLSHATLIIEAGKKSGSLMTAKYAEDYGRDVFAVPGSIYDTQSYGPHILIQQGAALITSAQDILKQLGFETEQITTNKMVPVVALPEYIQSDLESLVILDRIPNKKITIESLLEETRLPVITVNEKLSMLEIEGVIQIEGSFVRRTYK